MASEYSEAVRGWSPNRSGFSGGWERARFILSDSSRNEGRRRGRGRGRGYSRGRAEGWGRGRGEIYRGGRGDEGVCQNLIHTGKCRSGASCPYSHEVDPDSHREKIARAPRDRRPETSEQTQARTDYSRWKRLFRSSPRANEPLNISRIWTGALAILNGDDRDLKQQLPRDLDDEENYGRQHIRALMSMEIDGYAHSKFVNLAAPFMSVITHEALLECLTIDSTVGSLYSFISGTNGSRAVPFFQRLATSLWEDFSKDPGLDPKAQLVSNLSSLLKALHELLDREHRVAFHDDLPGLLDIIERNIELARLQTHLLIYQSMDSVQLIKQLRHIVARRKGLLQTEEANISLSSSAITSTFRGSLNAPCDRHDNDKLDISEISLFPTEMEIRSNHLEFLPSTDFNQPHFIHDPALRHLDTHFRLLRHDVFGDLKHALGGLVFGIENDPSIVSKSQHSLVDMRANSYVNAWISQIDFDSYRGLEASISFSQPPSIIRKSLSDRGRWWQESRRLERGTLLCLVSGSSPKSSLLLMIVTEKNIEAKGEHNLVSDGRNAFIKARLAAPNQQNNLELMLRTCYQGLEGILIEFPKIMLDSFIPILENLQKMQQEGRLPFLRWILPDRSRSMPGHLEIPPPVYSRKPGFKFSLSPILKDDASESMDMDSESRPDDLDLDDASESLYIDSDSRPDDMDLISKLVAHTELDRGQCEALVAALVREYAFIQGPPGTGKSYLGVAIMRVLLECQKAANLGPIIVVCFTNHALDQFLEHLINVGIEKVIRIGGQSKSSVLEGKNLRVVSKYERKTKSEGYLLHRKSSEIEAVEKKLKSTLGRLQGMRKGLQWESFRNHLFWNHPSIYEQFFQVDENGWEIVGDPFDIWARGAFQNSSVPLGQGTSSVKTMSEVIESATRDINSLSMFDRRRLIDSWTGEIRENTIKRLFELTKDAEKLRQEHSNIFNDVNRRVLGTADVIGVTTSGLAKNIATLRRVNSKVVVCEEAGEVLESHVISALLPTVEHVIQVGDHQQLRPKINNFKLSLESDEGTVYQLDRSQFERLSTHENTKFPVAQLNVQRRMRPEVSTLIRETLYHRLVDHADTKELPQVVGMRHNVFFLEHRYPEDGSVSDYHQKSHSNQWEVEMTYALVRHMVRQGVYSSTEIAVLTPYTGQLQKLRAKMRNEFEIILSDRDQRELAMEGFETEEREAEADSQSYSHRGALERKKLSDLLRIATVDNFQGEEAKIIIVSLVRSNNKRSAGFLATSNRINVLLSRAQHGMYLIGNTDTYSNVPMWKKVIGMLNASNSVATAFSLCCPQHPDVDIEVSQPEDFERLSPEGGCRLICDKRAKCGHRCKARCHSDAMHLVWPCPQPCERTHKPCNHSCKKATCGEDCGLCLERLNDVQLPCGHNKDNILCHQTQNLAKIVCHVPTEKEIPSCKHVITIRCAVDVSSDFKCPTPCRANLACGHECPGSCGDCGLSPDLQLISPRPQKHMSCKKVCGRRFATCNHTCSRKCHQGQECGPCFEPCQVRCAHSMCRERCREPCAPCIEKCTWSCEHKGACNMPCSAPCTRLPCNQRCKKTLHCGHQCPGICGETCPDEYCQICSNRQDDRVDLLELKVYSEIDLDETPIVVLSCGHFFTTESLDGLIGMNVVYEQDDQGEFVGLRDISGALAEMVPRCPDCNSQIRQYATQRYNRVVNRYVVDEMAKRFLVKGKAELRLLEKKVEELEKALETSREDLVAYSKLAAHTTNQKKFKVRELVGRLNARDEKSAKLQGEIRKFQEKVGEQHQPAQKLADATLHAMRQRPSDDMDVDTDMANSVPALARDHIITLGGWAAQHKIRYTILLDKFYITDKLGSADVGVRIPIPGGPLHRLAPAFFKACHLFINECVEKKSPKLAVEAIIYYATLARSHQSYAQTTKIDTAVAAEHIGSARELLEMAKGLCDKPFENSENLLDAIEGLIRLFRREWYEEVTAEELAAIKQAMVSGPSGIATHSGHWYNCINGHTFAIGDCGMPMEQARCPECGEPIGGQNHQAVAGVTRAIDMER